jgi:hypothetical protein
MSKPGNYTAYQQYKPLNDGTTQALQQWSNFYEQKRQNDIAQEQRDRQLKNQAEKEKQANIDKWLSYDSIPMTGVENVDMAHAKIAAADRAELQKLVGELVNTPDKFSERAIALQMQIDKIQKNPAVIKGMVSAPLKLAQEYLSGVDTKYVRTPQNENFFSNLKDARFTRNNNGDPAFIVKDPKDATKEIVLTEAEILNLQQIAPLIPKFDWEKLIKDNATILNKKPPVEQSIDPQTGYLITKEGYEQPTIQQVAKNMFSDEKGNPTETAISFLAQKGIYDITNIPDGKLQELENQFVTDITPFLVNKDAIKPNNYNLVKEKNETDAQYKKRMAAVAEKNANTKVEVSIGKGDIKTKLTPASFTYGGKNKKGQAVFGIKDNNLIINNKKENTQEVVEGFDIDPNNPKSIIVRGYKVTKDEEGVETRTPFSYESYSNPNDVLRFTSEAKMNIRQMHKTLMDVAGIKPKPKPKATTKPKAKETLEERKKRLGLK